jgi:hypothetical protein
MKLPEPISKKAILGPNENDPFAQTNQLGKDYASNCSRLEDISIMSGEQAALMAKDQLQRNIRHACDQSRA